VVFIGSKDFPAVGCTCGEAIYEEFGPFDIGPGGRGQRVDSSRVGEGESLGYSGCS